MAKANGLTVTPRGESELVTTRSFDAPRRLVFDALTRPDLLRRWYGQEGWTLTVCEIDLRPGGNWRFVSKLPDGRAIGQHGIYREVTAPERIARTENWEDWNPGEVVTITTLAERVGQTDLVETTVFPSAEVRAMLLKAGLANGAGESYDRLDALLASIVDEDP